MAVAAAQRDGRQYVTLGIDGEVFAVAVEQVEEILDLRPISHVPNAPACLLGMIDMRGRTVPVIDLRVKLGLPPAPPTPQTRIVVLDVTAGGRSLGLGLVADRVFEVAELDGGTLEAPPDIGLRWRSDYIRGVGRRGSALVIVLDLERLIAAADAAPAAG